MSIRKIIQYPKNETILRRKSQPVRAVNGKIKKLIRDLKDTLLDKSEGVGLAAVQVGIHLRVFVVRLGVNPNEESDDDDKPKEPPTAIINPEVIASSKLEKGFDGCLSMPGLFADTSRPNYLHIKGLNERGHPFERVFEGFDAVVVHHEIDHLDGVLFIDRVNGPEDLFTVKEDEDGKLVRVPISSNNSKKEEEE